MRDRGERRHSVERAKRHGLAAWFARHSRSSDAGRLGRAVAETLAAGSAADPDEVARAIREAPTPKWLGIFARTRKRENHHCKKRRARLGPPASERRALAALAA